VNRHASLEELARLAADDLKPRKAARIRHHLATCAQCTELNAQLSDVPTILSSVHFGPMPENLSARVETALAVESRQRLASEPATEAGRRDLPAARPARLGRSRLGMDRVGWRLPGLSVAATRALATAGAIALIGAGGYEIASHSGVSTSGPEASSGNATVPGAAVSQAVGAPVNYGHGTSARSIPTVSSDTDFEPNTLVQQVTASLQAAQLDNVHSGPTVAANRFAAPAAPATSTGLRNLSSSHALTGLNLGACIGRFAPPGRIVQLVEDARFKGKPATIIVTAMHHSRGAEVWVVGESCSASHGDVLAHVTVAHI
jgi:hypothetical protein